MNYIIYKHARHKPWLQYTMVIEHKININVSNYKFFDERCVHEVLSQNWDASGLFHQYKYKYDVVKCVNTWDEVISYYKEEFPEEFI